MYILLVEELTWKEAVFSFGSVGFTSIPGTITVSREIGYFGQSWISCSQEGGQL